MSGIRLRAACRIPALAPATACRSTAQSAANEQAQTDTLGNIQNYVANSGSGAPSLAQADAHVDPMAGDIRNVVKNAACARPTPPGRGHPRPRAAEPDDVVAVSRGGYGIQYLGAIERYTRSRAGNLYRLILGAAPSAVYTAN